MNLTIRTSHFAELLLKAARVTSSRPTLPVLASLQLTADGSGLRVAATNLDQSIATTGTATIHKFGAVCLPVRRLLSIIKALPEGDLKLSVDNRHNTSITQNGSVFKIMGMSASEFPVPPASPESNKVVVPAALFRSALESTAPAMSDDETRYILNAVFLRLKNKVLDVVATDGRRLVHVTVPAEADSPALADGLILPGVAVRALMGLLSEQSAVAISADPRRIAFTITPPAVGQGEVAPGPVTYTAKVVEGKYPDFSKVIPVVDANTVVVKLEREEFLGAVRRADLVHASGGKAVELKFDADTLSVTASDQSVGDAHELVSIPPVARAVKSYFCASFLLDVCKAVSDEYITMSLSSDTSPALFRAGDSFRAVIMPVRV